jgi:hypothetical protein
MTQRCYEKNLKLFVFVNPNLPNQPFIVRIYSSTRLSSEINHCNASANRFYKHKSVNDKEVV